MPEFDNGLLGSLDQIKAQVQGIPVPAPIFPPIVPTRLPSSQPPLVVGDPDAWWNNLQDVPNRIGQWAEAQIHPDVEEQCDELFRQDGVRCQITKAIHGAYAGQACRKSATTRYGECRARGGADKVTSPLYEGG